MKVLDGGRGKSKKGKHVCTWCADTFHLRSDLERHWKTSRSCGRNRTVSNAYNPNSLTFGVRPIMPGAHTLKLVRRAKDDDD